jgi:23S rRNA pseudouridine1911/1915/1917 synthase
MKMKAPKTASLLEILVEIAPDSSKNTLRSWMEEGRIEVSGKVIKNGKHLVKTGQEIVLGKRKQFIQDDIEILYEDDHLVVVYKPPGVLSVATDYDSKYNVHAYLKKRFKGRRVYPVHRLDREASGVMVFAYSKTCQEGLKSQFEEHSILREYIAIVEGDVLQNQGTWQSFLNEDSGYFVRSVPTADKGQLATTHYQVIKKKKGSTALKVTLETGRKNQIRVHCKEAGHPIIGDKKYGAKDDWFGRLALHALKLGFHHPFFEKPMLFERIPDGRFGQYLP